MGVDGEPGSSTMSQVAAALALAVVAALVLCVICELAYDVTFGLADLIGVLLLSTVALALVITLDVLSWRCITGAHVPKARSRGAREATTLAAAALPLLILGAVLSVMDVAYGEKDTTFASWTSTTVVYLLLAALAAQIVLIVITWLMRRTVATPGR